MSTSTENTSDIVPIHATRRAVLPTVAALIRNPLETIPPEAFSEPIVFSRIAGKLRAHVLDPVLIHEALVKNAGALSKGEEMRRALGPALGEGLLTADGPHWKWQRQSVAGAFRHEKLVELQPAMIDAATRTRDRLLDGTGPVDISWRA